MYKLLQHIIFYSIIVFVLMSCGGSDEFPDMKEKYSFRETIPFGGSTAYNIFRTVYADKFINVNKKPFSKFYDATHFDSASFYFSLSKKFYVNEEDAQAVLDFVYEGNTAFISAAEIDAILLDKIYSQVGISKIQPSPYAKVYSNATVKLLPDEYSTKDSFSYYYIPFLNYFSKVHGDRGRVTGFNQQGKPNFTVFFWGKGRLYLHCEPRALSNYFLLTGDNHLYLKQILQMMHQDPGNVFWDDYYNKINYRDDPDESFSTFSAIMKRPALAMAFWIALGMLVLYILFGMKRKQRIVPVIKPVENSSIAFTEAIAGLYLTEKNNKNMAEKMMGYFNEHVRTSYFLNVNADNKDFITSLSKKSGVEEAAVQSLYAKMQQVSLEENVSDFELLSLNEQIQLFYKKRI